MKPKIPIQADTRGKSGLSKSAAILEPILWRKEINVNAMKNNTENEIAIAMNTGVDAVGAERRRSGALLGRASRLYWGESDGLVQLRPAALFGREQEPNTPRNALGPSTTCDEPVSRSAVEGTTVKRATLSWSSKVGARKAKSDKIIAVKAKRGAR